MFCWGVDGGQRRGGPAVPRDSNEGGGAADQQRPPQRGSLFCGRTQRVVAARLRQHHLDLRHGWKNAALVEAGTKQPIIESTFGSEEGATAGIPHHLLKRQPLLHPGEIDFLFGGYLRDPRGRMETKGPQVCRWDGRLSVCLSPPFKPHPQPVEESSERSATARRSPALLLR